MTIKELSKYYNIKREISQIEDDIKELELTVIGSSKLTGMPSQHGDNSPTELIVTKIVKLKEKLNLKKENLVIEYEKIENFLDDVDDEKIRLLIRKRFLECKTWNDIGKELHYHRTTPYYKLQKYLKNYSEELNKGDGECIIKK